MLGAYKVMYDLAAADAPQFTAVLYDRYGSYTVPQIWLTAFAWIALGLVVFGMPKTLALGQAVGRDPRARAA